MDRAKNLYDSLFNGKTAKPHLSEETQAWLEEVDKQAEARIAAMTEEEKIAEFNRIMGR